MRKIARITHVLLVFLLAILPALVTTGCRANDPPRYALCMSHLTNHFTNALAASARARAIELGVELVVLDAQQDSSRQIGQIETLLEDGIAGLLIEPVAETGLEDVLETAMRKQVPVVLVTQKIGNPSLYDCFVGTNAFNGGQLEMTACVEALDHQGDLVVLLGPVGSQASAARYAGYLAVLEDQPDIRIVAELNADWNIEKAEDIVSNWLQAGKHMDAIVAQNDEMAIGAVKALSAAGLTSSIQVFGMDASDQALQAIRQNEMTATVSQQTAIQGSRALDVCHGLTRGETFPDEILVPQVLITIQNIDTIQQ
ncbi:MAG: sugar ABC transporter substrate-binding protein [Clostridia bacterium]|nr:sugar ABC transporter substrate-binding protein [Clostridia bacterium]